MRRLAFTLVEIMIVLTIIGILTAILLPIGIQLIPNEHIMKFKKAHNTFYQTIDTLITSGEYYLTGDLGTKPDGTLIDGNHDRDNFYFCQTFAKVLSTKSVNCSNYGHLGKYLGVDIRGGYSGYGQTMEQGKRHVDNACAEAGVYLGNEIQTTDDISYYEVVPWGTFGYLFPQSGTRYFLDTHTDANGFGQMYKIFCIDIDGVSTDVNKPCDDNTDICPFGYGIRADGKILSGERADRWLEKSVLDKDLS